MTISVTKTQIAGVLLLILGWINPEQYIHKIDLPFTDPTTVSIEHEGAMMLVVDEAGERDPKIADMLAAPEVRSYLTAHKVDWRQWDDDTTTGPSNFKALLALKLNDSPSLILADGKRAKVLKCPTSADELLTILKEKWGA